MLKVAFSINKQTPFDLHLECPQYCKISNLIIVQLNIAHAMYILNCLHVALWHIFEVFNHTHNAIFKYNVIYYIGRII